MKKIYMLLFAIAMMATMGQAAAKELTASEALSRLLNDKAYVNSHSRRAQKINKLKLAYTSRHDFGNSYYAFNCGNSEGFMILGADDTMPALLGYSDEGTFDFNRIPKSMKWFLSRYDKEAQKRNVTGIASQTRVAIQTEISPLLGDIIWDQSTPFNNYCPDYEEETSATGCVATAMAQVMRYHEWPVSGTGTRTYTFDFTIAEGETTSMTISDYSFEHELDWENMIADYTGDYTEEQGSAVAQLMVDCGVAAKMAYGLLDAGGSAALSDAAAEGMKEFFDYDEGISVVYMEDEGYTQEQWEELIYTELSNLRPVILGGNGESGTGGHEFVCDGCDDNGYFHINWGWSGSCNGYFVLSGPGLVPEETGSGGAEAGDSYGYQLEAIIGIQPNQESTGIRNKTATPDASQPMYNLMGVRVNTNAPHGLYIQNGKKILVK